MRFLMNDLSIHGQFKSVEEFICAVRTIMTIRSIANRSGVDVVCSEMIASSYIAPNIPMSRAVQAMERNERRAWMSWITNHGLYWQTRRQHSDSEWMTTDGEVIATNQAIGEAAYCKSLGISYSEIVSAAPSDWLRHPIVVTWACTKSSDCRVELGNHWMEETVRKTLGEAEEAPRSWEQLAARIVGTLNKLSIAEDAFAPLYGYPFQPSVADDISQLLGVLNTMSGAFDDEGRRTKEFDALYDLYFKGHHPHFTDESDTNLSAYGRELVFPDPRDPSKNVRCSWHGKINSRGSFPLIRIHHTWPPKKDVGVHVAYIGPKITTR